MISFKGTVDHKPSVPPILKNHFVHSYAPYIFNLITIIVLVMFALRPTILTISTLQKQISDNQRLLDALNAKAKAIEKGRDNLKALDQSKKDRIQAAVPTNPEVVALVNSLQGSITTQASVSALQIQPVTLAQIPEASTSGSTADKVEFSFNTAGNYQQALTTLDNLLKTSRILTINEVTFSKKDADPLILSITGSASYLK